MDSQMNCDSISEIVVSSIILDIRRNDLYKKMLLKRQELEKIVQETTAVKEGTNKLRDEIEKTREAHVKSAEYLQNLTNSKISSENLYLSASKKLEMARSKYRATVSAREEIAAKYEAVLEKYKQTYASLSYNKEMHDKEYELKLNNVKLKQEKRHVEEYRKKFIAMKSMTELILKQKILAFANLMSLRQNYVSDIIAQTNINSRLEQEIFKLRKGKEQTYYFKKFAKKVTATPPVTAALVEPVNSNMFIPIRERLGIVNSGRFLSSGQSEKSQKTVDIDYPPFKTRKTEEKETFEPEDMGQNKAMQLLKSPNAQSSPLKIAGGPSQDVFSFYFDAGTSLSILSPVLSDENSSDNIMDFSSLFGASQENEKPHLYKYF